METCFIYEVSRFTLASALRETVEGEVIAKRGKLPQEREKGRRVCWCCLCNMKVMKEDEEEEKSKVGKFRGIRSAAHGLDAPLRHVGP